MQLVSSDVEGLDGLEIQHDGTSFAVCETECVYGKREDTTRGICGKDGEALWGDAEW
jgi:hypothetical protein